MYDDKVIVEQPIFCGSYNEALQISKAFEGFRFWFVGLGGIKAVRAKRRISKLLSSEYYSHCVKVVYSIDYYGAFDEYGFLDKLTIKKHPELISLLKNESPDRRWKIISKYQAYEDDFGHDIYYYESFQDFFKSCLISYLNKLFMASTISLADVYRSDIFIIRYIEREANHEFAYFAKERENRTEQIDVRKYANDSMVQPISIQLVWDWINTEYYSSKDGDFSEARAITALSYVLNRTPSEQVFYAVVGIESIFTKNEHGVKAQLKRILPRVFSFITEEEVSDLYKLRSEFVHGDLIFPLYYGQRDYWRDSTIYWDAAKKLAALLMLSIRLLVQNNAIKILLDQTESVIYIRGQTFCDLYPTDRL